MMMMNIERSKRQEKKKKENVLYYLPILQTLAEKQTDKLNVYLDMGRQL
jgi:hypothetical protein